MTGGLGQALAAVARALSSLPSPGMLIGGLAVIARGVPRLTRDVGATIPGEALAIAPLLDTLREYDLIPRFDDAIAFATKNQVVLLRHEPSGIDVDVSIAWLPFELEALAAAVAFRPQDRQDIERLLALHRASVDLDRVRRIVREFAEALDAPERPADLERIIAQVGPP